VAAHGAHYAIIEREAVEAVARSKAAEWENAKRNCARRNGQCTRPRLPPRNAGWAAYMEKDKVYANLADIARMLESPANWAGCDGG